MYCLIKTFEIYKLILISHGYCAKYLVIRQIVLHPSLHFTLVNSKSTIEKKTCLCVDTVPLSLYRIHDLLLQDLVKIQHRRHGITNVRERSVVKSILFVFGDQTFTGFCAAEYFVKHCMSNLLER